MIGFLDNNKERHGKPLYGTDKLVYLPSTVDYKNITVIVCDCPYKKEIIAGLKELSDSINIISIDMFLN